jgi:hypothetical protein
VIRAVIESTQGIRFVTRLPPLTWIRSTRRAIAIGGYRWNVVLPPPSVGEAEAERVIREYLACATLRLLGLEW